MKKSTKINIAVTTSVVLIFGVVAFFLVAKPFAPPREEIAAQTPVVEENTHRLDEAADGKVTIVEFLDFECEVCGAVYPAIEQLREEYAGEVTFAFRYFPIPSHKNSMNAALAVEAASQQGKLEEMYERLFVTQAEWGEQQDSKAELFRNYASELGLDLAQFDAAIASPATQARVKADFDAGRALGVDGTPTFFVNGKAVEVSSIDDIREALDAALLQ